MARGLNRLIVIQHQAERLPSTIQTDGGARDLQPGAEFLRLDLRPRGQRLTGNAGRETQVVLDLRTGPGLAARRYRLEYDRVEPFGSSIDRSSQSGRPRADDGDIELPPWFDRFDQAQRLGESGRRRIAQYTMARGNDDRQIGRRQLQGGHEAFGVGIGFDVQSAVRVAVARQETFETQRVGGMHRADQQRPAMRLADQGDAPQDEGAHDDLADIRLAGHQSPKLAVPDADDGAGAAHPSGDDHLAIVEHVQLTGELPGAHRREDLRNAMFVAVENFDHTVQDQEKIDTALSVFEDRRAVGQNLASAVGGHPFDHLAVQTREGLRLAQGGVGRIENGELAFIRHGWETMRSCAVRQRRNRYIIARLA